MVLGIILIVVGGVWFAQTIGLLDHSAWQLVIPWILIYLGVTYIISRRREQCMICHLIDKDAVVDEMKAKKIKRRK